MEKAYLITHNTDLNKNFQIYDRIYIWDSYCEHNLLYFLNNNYFIEKIISLNKKITLNTPIISEKCINNLFIFINKYRNLKWFEVVVNDYWVFYELSKNYKDIKIVCGNFLSWQSKDPYLKFFKDKKFHKNLTIDSDYYRYFFDKNNIWSIELYNVFQWINLKNNYSINLYYPYVTYSSSRYCISNLIKNNKTYLTIPKKCHSCKWKTNNILSNILNNPKDKKGKIKNFYIWNKQFYENKTLNKNKKINRIIYNYDLLNNDW